MKMNKLQLCFSFCEPDDIDSHIENAVVATSQAKGQLSKAAKTQKSNSSLVISEVLLHFVNILDSFLGTPSSVIDVQIH